MVPPERDTSIGPPIGSLDLPLVMSIGIVGREGGITCKQLDNKAKPE
jgi:hypothetical protein